MGMQPFPSRFRRRWRRLDVPGWEECRIDKTDAGWRLAGKLEVAEAGVHARHSYVIDCDAPWRTRRAHVGGSAGGTPIQFDFTADGHGAWTLNGAPRPEVAGAIDIDLGFTPTTNLVPIRRLEIGVGQETDVRAAWLRFPELRVEALEQTYAREAPQAYRFRAHIDGGMFTARLDTDEFGCVVRYGDLWAAEPARA